jgi:hypothetical protein
LAGKEQGVIGMNTFNGDPKLGGKRHLWFIENTSNSLSVKKFRCFNNYFSF